jgi:hypothetical protein
MTSCITDAASSSVRSCWAMTFSMSGVNITGP